MAEQSLSKWEQVIYSPQNKRVPLQRWGHKLVLTKDRQIYMFGGFGGESSQGRYLNDLWKFDLSTYQWKEINTSGKHPQSRSNYTFHYNQKDDQLILFGGGTSSKLRFNNVSILHLNTMVWENITPNAAQQAPWERTYHCSEFHYPYLIVHGGEGVSCIDLDDTWVFNIINRTWKKLQFQQNCEKPSPRRFHCSAIVNNKFYIFGGCKDNYELLGDMYRVDLKQLLLQGKTSGLVWEKIMSNNPNLERWGHTCDIYNNKMYIFAGRINSTSDTFEMMVFNPQTNVLQKMNVHNSSIPRPRRRHATIIVGNCLLSFGGYNGKYLNDFYFIGLPKETIEKQSINTKITYRYADYINQISKQQKKLKDENQLLIIKTGQNQQSHLKTNRTILQNQYFKYMHQYAQTQNICIQLPSFCNIDMFRAIHLSILTGNLVVCKVHPLNYYLKLIKSAEYFNCSFLIAPIQQYLLSLLNSSNCLQMLHISIELGLNFLKLSSAEMQIKNNCPFKQTLTVEKLDSCKQYTAKTSDENLVQMQNEFQKQPLNQIFLKVLKIYKFQIQQRQMRSKMPNFFVKTASKIKRMFSKPQQSKEQQGSQSNKKDSSTKNRGCLDKIINFFASLGTGGRVSQ